MRPTPGRWVALLPLVVACGDSTPTQPQAPTPVASVEVAAPSTILRTGQVVQLTATTKGPSGQTLAGRPVTWASDRDSIASVNASGLVTAKNLGTAVITATSEGRSGQISLSITPVPVGAVVISPDSASLTVGRTLQFTAVVRDSVGADVTDRAVQWATSDTTRATVSSSGLVTAVRTGDVTISASVEGRTGQGHLTVHPVPVATVTVHPQAPSIAIDGTIQLAAVLLDAAGDTLVGRAVTWSSSEPTRATVSARGLVVGVSAGSTVITAQSEGRSGATTVTVAALPAGLSSADSTTLTRHLDRIAASSSWVQPSVDTANAIFVLGTYSDAHWRAFFTAYFATRPFTEPLALYISYPIFHWFGDAVHRRLQAGIGPVASAKIRAVLASHADGLPAALQRDPLLGATLTSFLSLLGELAETGVSGTYAAEVANLATDLVRDYPAVILGPVSDERAIRRLVGFTWMGVLAAEPLSAARKPAIAAALQLSPWQWQILDRHSVLIYDRFSVPWLQDRLDDGQLSVIEALLRLTPAGLHDLRAVTVADGFGLFPNVFHCCFYTRYRGRSIISTGEPRLGPTENPFPQDVAPRPTPFFSTILVHELNHAVDNVLYTRDPRYKQRRDALIAAAGSDSLNYLRSMIPSGIFVTAPVEAFSSISQQWLADSEHTLRLGRARFDGGRRHPLNQALWIAEVYSMGSGTTPLYRMTDPAGAMSRVDAPVTRDGAGNITSLVVGDSTYTFVRQTNGDVISYSIRANP